MDDLDKPYFDEIISIKNKIKDNDNRLSKISKEKYDKFINTKLNFIEKISFNNEGFTGKVEYGKRARFNIKRPENYENKVIKNIRFYPQDIINSVEIEIGGSRFDKLWNKQSYDYFKAIRHLLKIKDDTILPFNFLTGINYLPFVESNEIELNFEFKNNDNKITYSNTNENDKVNDNQFYFCLSYEIYELVDDITHYQTIYTNSNNENNENKENKLEYFGLKSCYTGPDNCNTRNFTFKSLWCFDNLFYLFVYIDDNELKELCLKIITKDKEEIILKPIIKKFKNYYIIELVKSLSFDDIKSSSIDFINIDIDVLLEMNLKYDNPCTIHVNGLSGRLINISGGKYEL